MIGSGSGRGSHPSHCQSPLAVCTRSKMLQRPTAETVPSTVWPTHHSSEAAGAATSWPMATPGIGEARSARRLGGRSPAPRWHTASTPSPWRLGPHIDDPARRRAPRAVQRAPTSHREARPGPSGSAPGFADFGKPIPARGPPHLEHVWGGSPRRNDVSDSGRARRRDRQANQFSVACVCVRVRPIPNMNTTHDSSFHRPPAARWHHRRPQQLPQSPSMNLRLSSPAP